jgi:hypothetical protein
MNNQSFTKNDVVLERSDAIELHEAIAPWESRKAPYWKFLLYLSAAAVAGLLVGSLIDNFVEWAQGNQDTPKRISCFQWFFIQIVMIITVLFVFNRIISRKDFGFVPWLLMTLSGFLFTLTLVNVQNSLTSNAICLFSFK